MKTIRCSQCKKEKEVSDNWAFKLCPICRDKNLKKRDLEKRAKEAREGLDPKNPKYLILKNYSYFTRQLKRKMPKEEVTFDTYLEFCEGFRKQERQAEPQSRFCRDETGKARKQDGQFRRVSA